MNKYMVKQFLVILLLSCQLIHADLNLQGVTLIECEVRPRVTSETKERHFTHPHVHVKESASLNWAGYAVVTSLSSPANNAVTSVSGTWQVPTISRSSGTTYSSLWVGMDGYSSSTVEQIGTEHNWANGKQQNYVWFEMYPQYPYEIVGFPLSVGDSISASVVYKGNNVFQMTIVNNTRNVAFVVPTSYTTSALAKRSSAEWIAEAPYSSSVLPLADFHTITFSNCMATINGINGAINNPVWKFDPLTMITNNGAVKALISTLTSNGKGFSVTWNHQ